MIASLSPIIALSRVWSCSLHRAAGLTELFRPSSEIWQWGHPSSTPTVSLRAEPCLMPHASCFLRAAPVSSLRHTASRRQRADKLMLLMPFQFASLPLTGPCQALD